MVRGLRSALAGLFGHPAPAAKPTPSVPAGLILYAVGDIHGETAALDRLLARIAEDIEGRGDGRRAQLIFLGDYVDRGSDSAGVLDRLCVGPLPGVDGRFLAGNHEQAMLDFLEDPTGNAGWLAFGGVATLASYGIRASAGSPDSTRCRALRDQLVERLPDSHLTFLRGLESHAMVGDYLFVHAGIRPGRRVEDQTREDLLWIREPFLSSHRDHGKIVVHGHTVVDQPEIRTNRIAIDTGAYATGILTALVLSETAHKILQS